jgi:N-ethylmaleimide reductase
MPHYPEIDDTYDYLSKKNKIGIAYIHLVDHSAMGAPPVPMEKNDLEKLRNALILCGGYNQETAEAAIASGLVDLVAFEAPFINNPCGTI